MSDGQFLVLIGVQLLIYASVLLPEKPGKNVGLAIICGILGWTAVIGGIVFGLV